MMDKNRVAALYVKILNNLKSINGGKQRLIATKKDNFVKAPSQDSTRTKSKIANEEPKFKIIEQKVNAKEPINSHEKMLSNELKAFKIEVEKKYASSASNSYYSYPYKCNKNMLIDDTNSHKANSFGKLITSLLSMHDLL